MDVSVVVAVWNPGHYLADLVASLRAQTLPAERWEAILVDDGSTDGTAEALDAIAAQTTHFRVVHAEHSGWPGHPRNLGIDAARGDYVFIADHDDRLAPDALERLTAFAREHDADVVVGTMVGIGRSVPRVFDRTVVDAQDRPDLLISSLTPQKLYRRALLDGSGIRFPEGVRRLEDHVFVAKAYLRARRVSIYADSPVYYFVLRDDGQNASRRPIEWAGYFENAAEAIAVVDAEAPDEATRLLMRRRWLRIEALRRVRGARYLRRGDDRHELVAAVRRLIDRHYSCAEIDALTVFDRVAARLVLDGRDADLLAFAEWEATVRVRPVVTAASLDPATGALLVELAAAQRAQRPRPDVLLEPPAGYPGLDEIAAMEAVPPDARVTVLLRRTSTDSVPATVEQRVDEGVLTASAAVAQEALGAGRWTVRTSFSGLQRVPADEPTVPEGERARLGPAAVAVAGREVALLTTDDGRLVVRVEQVRRPSWTVRRVAAAVRRRAGRLRP